MQLCVSSPENDTAAAEQRDGRRRGPDAGAPRLIANVIRPSTMTIDDFIAMTRRIIAKDGFEEYLPTLVLPERRHVTVLEGMPSDVDPETASREWATSEAGENEDYFLAVKIDPVRFKVVARLGGVEQERVATAEAG
jgi:hypothetical protein